MATKSIHSRAPTRIDLAGGTLDIWPLYLFLKNPLTVNLGIDLFAEAVIEITSDRKTSKNGSITLKSEDQNHEMKFSWKEFAQGSTPPPPPSLELHYKLLRFFFDKKKEKDRKIDSSSHLLLRTRARSPAGAGLGGSSTLSIAMIGALATWAGIKKFDGEAFIEIVRDVETTVIKVPAGLQDYYGAMYGGLQSLRWGPGTHEQTWLPKKLISQLEKRLLLFYSGQSRNSGINNWELFKSFIDNRNEVRSKFEKISAATESLEKALRSQDWMAVGQAIAEEWSVRKTLAPGITTPEIDQAFQEAQKVTHVSGKVCGAGGGGCFFVYIPTEDDQERSSQKARIQKIFLDKGIRPLDFRGVSHGLEVRSRRA